MNASRLSPHSAARLTAGMLLAAGCYAGLAALVMLVVRYSPLREHIPATTVYPLQIALFVHIVAAVVFLFAARRLRSKRAVALIVPRVLICLLALSSIVSIDLIVGIFYPPSVGLNSLYERHIERGWTNRPNAFARSWLAWIRFDGRGLRIHEDLLDPDPPGSTHILFVGDSVTLGYNLPARASFAWWTARMLNERHPQLDVEALNGGTCGYDMSQERNWFEEVGLGLDPDLVVLQFCMNDVAGQFDPTLPPSREQHVEIVLAEPPNDWSGIQRAIFDIRRRMKYGSDLREAARRIEHFTLEEVIGPEPPEHVQRALTYALEDIDRIRATAEKKRKPLLFVIFPIFAQLDDPSDPGRPQQKLCSFAESKGMHYLDLLPVYRRAIAEGATPQELLRDETHPSRLGHRVAARAIVEYIEKHNLLGELRPSTQSANDAP